jgi:hypothetical protein
MSPARIIRRSAIALMGFALAARAQAPAGSLSAVIAPSMASWKFGEPLTSDSFPVRSVSHLTIPIGAQLRMNRLTVDVGASHTAGSVELEDGRTLTLSGLTDVRVRGVAEVIPDRVLLTLGLNVPTGQTGLTGDRANTLGILGGSSLGFPTLALGNGFGVTAGLVYAFSAGPWGVALGSSYEARSQYTPLEVLIAGDQTPAEFDPGEAIRASLALDRLLGNGRMSVLLAADFYGENLVQIGGGGGSTQGSRYTPGAQYSAALAFDLGISGFRSFRVTLADRYRSEFTAADGTTTEGSSGNVFEAALEMIRGGARGLGVYLRADARMDAGLEIDNTIATAAMTSAGASLGLSFTRGTISVLPFVRAQAGNIDVGPASTSATGFGAGITLTARP